MFNRIKLSPAQLVILHLLESLLASFALTVAAGTFQYIATHGLDFAGLGAFWATAFLGALAMIYKSLASNPNFLQAVMDSLTELRSLVVASNAASAPIVTIHANDPLVQPVIPPAAPQLQGQQQAVQPVQQMPFPGASPLVSQMQLQQRPISQDTTPWSAISALNLPGNQGQGQQGR